jgi:tetratricopeptide (TPR) repeat protein
MGGFQKHQLAGLLAAGLWIVASQPALPQGETGDEPGVPSTAEVPESAPADREAKLDELFAELKQPGRDDWEKIEAEITRIWSQSGSPAMDLLLARGNQALEAEDYPGAVEHFSALIDHAPDFAEGWNGRATAFYLMGEYGLSINDVEHVLALNPRHFGALAGLAYMLESMDEPELALDALHSAQALNPNQPDIGESITRLERMTGDAEL